jgi:hypothetical protein
MIRSIPLPQIKAGYYLLSYITYYKLYIHYNYKLNINIITMEKVSLKYEAYTDGSCDNLSPYGEGGSAYIILKDGIIIKESKKGFVGTTNNRMEMLAIISAVKSVPKGATLTGIHRFSILYNELYELQETQKELRLNKPLSSLRRITP